jgi:hypothetical protein
VLQCVANSLDQVVAVEIGQSRNGSPCMALFSWRNVVPGFGPTYLGGGGTDEEMFGPYMDWRRVCSGHI